MEMYGRVWCVMEVPQIMGCWRIVLIQQTNAVELGEGCCHLGLGLGLGAAILEKANQLFPKSMLRSDRSLGKVCGPRRAGGGLATSQC